MKKLALLLFLFSCNACSPYRVDTTKGTNVNFSEYQTFKFEEDDSKATEALSEYQKAIEIMKDEVRNQLIRRGLSEAADADLSINIGATVKEKQQTRRTTIQEAPIYIGQRRYRWESKEIVVGEYEEGSATVAIGDPEKNNLIWEGTVSKLLKKNDQLTEQEIRQGIQQLFKKFP